MPESSLSRNIEDSKLTTFKKMAKITLTWNPGKASVEKRIIKLITANLESYEHKIDNCYYFILSDQLYGLRKLDLPSVTSQVNIFWKDECIFKLENGKLIKDPTDDFEIIETYHELIDFYNILRLI